MARRRGRPLALALAFAAGCSIARSQQPDHLAIVFPYPSIGNIDRSSFPEPSGIIYHPGRGTLFVVSDEGHICEMSVTGEMLHQSALGGDFEGVTLDPATGLLYVAIEGEDAVIEVNPAALTALRKFAIDRTFQGRTVMKEGGQGIEGITFVPDAKHPEGGTFLIANQSFALSDSEDLSRIFEVVLPLRTKGGTGKIIREMSLGVVDIADLYYDAKSGDILAICDAPNLFLEVTPRGEVVRYYALPGDNQEGITLDADGNLYLAQDSGGIIKFAPPP